MNDAMTIGPERRRLALQCTYELEGLADTMMMICPETAPEFRGMALRVRALAAVVMSIAADDGVNDAELRDVIYGAAKTG